MRRALGRGAAFVAVLAALLASGSDAARAADADGPMAVTRRVLERSHEIVAGSGDHQQKLVALNDLLRGFLDTDALSRDAIGAHTTGQSEADVEAFRGLFRELFVRTYVQRLLLFDVPEFAYGEEKVTGDTATVGTEIVTPRDRFAVDYRERKAADGWRATDIVVEGVSIAGNFRAQFDTMLAKNSFQEMLDLLRKKLEARTAEAGR